MTDSPLNAANSVAATQGDGKRHLLLAASGSVATIKLPLILSHFEHHTNLSIRVILTPSASHFLSGQSPEQPSTATLLSIPNVDAIYTNADEWSQPWTRDVPILHIELRRWAHVLVVAPMSANLLAKVAGGLCDDLLTCVIRAWDTGRQILVAPAMNTMMWEHPITAKQIAVIEEWKWMHVLPPQGGKQLACGDVGAGAMCDWMEVVAAIEAALRGDVGSFISKMEA